MRVGCWRFFELYQALGIKPKLLVTQGAGEKRSDFGPAGDNVVRFLAPLIVTEAEMQAKTTDMPAEALIERAFYASIDAIHQDPEGRQAHERMGFADPASVSENSWQATMSPRWTSWRS